MEVNDLRSQSDLSLRVRHGLIDICTKFQVPISFLAATAHNIVFMQKSVGAPPPCCQIETLDNFADCNLNQNRTALPND